MYKIVLFSIALVLLFEEQIVSSEVPKLPLEETSNCSLPAPSNLKSTLIGTYFIYFEWGPVPGAAYFRVNVFNSSTNTMIYSRLVTASPVKNGVVIDDLPPGISFKVKIHSVCSNGFESPKTN